MSFYGLIAITIHLEGFGPPKKDDNVFKDSDEISRVAATQQTNELLFQKGPNYLRTPADIPQEPGVLRAGTEGASMPICIKCPAPQYSDASRGAKFQGRVQLSVIVTEAGKATSISCAKAPFWIDRSSRQDHSRLAV